MNMTIEEDSSLMERLLLDQLPELGVVERVAGYSAWIGHVPFGMLLISLIKPKVFVELGTFSGDSYFAFCQVVKHQHLKTKCFAVDTWQGDPQGGFYSESVYKDFNRYHDQHYSDCSQILRMTFDEALGNFSDGEVDLLHIDGLHTYEAVRHDYETWSSKVSDAGVVLFHDIAVQKEGFGVAKFWNEVKGDSRYIEFDHSNGLGVLVVGNRVTAALDDLLTVYLSNPERFRKYFEWLGLMVKSIQDSTRRELKLQREVNSIHASKRWKLAQILCRPLDAIRHSTRT